MSDNNSHFPPCHLSPEQPAQCRCCPGHRRKIDELVAELDAERAAAATGASDWMYMIRHLQREKSDAMLESKHLKRLSEEQILKRRSQIEALEEALRKKEETILSLSNDLADRNKEFDDLPQWVKHTMRLKKDQKQKEHNKKRKAEDHLCTIIKVSRDEDLSEQIGNDIYFDLVDHDKVRSFQIRKQLPFTTLKEEVAKEFGIPMQFQRWLWAKRENHTFRPNRPLTTFEELQTVGTLSGGSKEAYIASELMLFLEVELGLDLSPLPPPDKSRGDILIFFKLYDPEKEELRYVGRMYVKAVGRPLEILAKLNELAGFPQSEDIDLFEEIRFEPNIMCEPIDKRISFHNNLLEDGDIICFQKAIVSNNETNYRYSDVPSFLKSVL